MGKIEDIREGLAAAIRAVEGLQAEPYARDIASVPVAMVGGPDPLEFDKTFGRGHDDYVFPVIIFSSRTVEEVGQHTLDAYLDPFGPLSVKTAIEADSTLGGVVEDLRVESAREYGPHDINGVTYLGAVLVVAIMAPGKA